MRNRAIAFILILVFALAGCATEGIYEDELSFGAPVRLENGLALQESLNRGVIFLELFPSEVVPRQLFVPEEGEEVLSLIPGPDPEAARELFVITGAEDSRETSIVETLHRVDPAVEEIVEYSIGSFFGESSFSPDGRFMVLYHGENDASLSEGLYNPNEVAVIDLDAAPGDDNPKIISIGLGGRTVASIFFPEAVDVAGKARQLVVFGASGVIKAIDLLDTEQGTMSAKLIPDDDPRTVIPSKVVTRAGDELRDPILFVMAAGSQDLYAFTLLPDDDGTDGFTASLSQYDGGYSPSDFLVLEDGDRVMLLIAQSYSTYALLVDVDTAAAYELSLEDRASTLMLRGEEGAKEAVIYGNDTSYFFFLTVDGVAEELGSNLEPMLIPDGAYTSTVLDEDRMVVVPYYSSGLALIDLAEKEVTRLSSSEALDPAESLIHNDVFFVGGGGDDRVVSLDLRTGHPEPLLLDESIRRFDIFPAQNVGFVLHGTDTGRGTLFPLDNPTRNNARIFDGLWLDLLFDREEVDQ